MTAGCSARLVGIVLVVACTALEAGERLDVLIHGGSVLDGTGQPERSADVGIRGGKIVAVGTLDRAGARTLIDATGLVVAPGFIDAHNHTADDVLELTGPLPNEGFLTQGVTTIVDGPDGRFSPEQIRAVADQYVRQGLGTNFAFYVGHNGIRASVMGDSQQRAPTSIELTAMKAAVREGMELGAVGLSTGLMYEPGMFSTTEEVIELAKEVQPFGGIYDSHTRNPVFDMLGSHGEAIEIGRAAGIPVKIAHIKPVGLHNRGRSREEIALIEKARAAGQEVFADQYPYDGAATRVLEELIVMPGYARGVVDRDAVREAFAEPATRAALRISSEEGIDGGFSWVKAVGYGSLRIVDAPGDPELVGWNIQLMAESEGRSPFDVVADLILAHEAPILITLGALEESDLRAELAMPWNMIASDGAYLDPRISRQYHPRSTGTFTRVLGHYVREVKLLALPEAVRKMTSLPADHLGFLDRGRVEEGYGADIVVFDPEIVGDRSTYSDPTALSVGIVHVLVNGVPALRDGKITGATEGRWIKRQDRCCR
jgi:N-acyl-D-amino-acid deacylase